MATVTTEEDKEPLAVSPSALHELFHETKNPLQVIISSVDLLERSRNPEMQALLYGMIRESVARVNGALNRLAEVREADLPGEGR